jgi:hypothetical protein
MNEWTNQENEDMVRMLNRIQRIGIDSSEAKCMSLCANKIKVTDQSVACAKRLVICSHSGWGDLIYTHSINVAWSHSCCVRSGWV